MPDSARNSHDLGVIAEMELAEPTIATMSQVKAATTQVRSAVATSESMVLIPHLARMDTMPANNADANAATSQSCTITPATRRSFSPVYVPLRSRWQPARGP